MASAETSIFQFTPSSAPEGGAGAAVISLINIKGGVGKTTTAVSLATALSIRHRVLLVDLDPQAAATISVGIHAEEVETTFADVLCSGTPVERAIRPTDVAGLDIICGSMDLAVADSEPRLNSHWNGHLRLRQALQQVRHQYGYILLDCAPSFSLTSRSALIASDGFVVPVVPHYLAVNGLLNLLNAVQGLRERYPMVGSLWGILPTMVDYRTRAAHEIVSLMRNHYGDLVFDTEIPINIRLAEAPAAGRSIYEHALTSRGARHYWDFSKELDKRVKQKREESARRRLRTIPSLS